MSDSNNIREKTITSMLWSFFGRTGIQLVSLVVQIIVARLLNPEIFGIIGMVAIFISISETFIDSGFTKGLIRQKNTSQEDYSTVFFFNLITSIVFYFILFFGAGQISNFFGEPLLIPIVRVLGIVLIINAFGLIQRTMLIKNIDFKAQAKIETVSSLISGAITIIMAYTGFGVWSLVARQLIMQLSQAILFSLTTKWRPSLTFSVDSFRNLFNFGSKLLLSSIFSKIYENIYSVIIGRVFSTADLGLYTKAKNLKDTAAMTISSSVQKVSYPVLSNMQDNNTQLKKGFKKIIKNSVYITFPVMLGLAAVAPRLLILLLGNDWATVIPYFQILTLSGMLYPLHSINLNILQVKGRSDLYLKINVYKKILGLVLIGIVFVLGLGMIGLLWSIVLTSYGAYFLNGFYSNKLLGYSIKEQLSDIKMYYVISILMFIVVYGVGLLELPLLLLVVLEIITGVVVYVGLSKLFKIEELNTMIEVMQMLSKRLKKGKNKVK